MRMIKIITAQSYFGLFDALKNQLKGKTRGLDGRNIVFCEEKSSLMAERIICSEFSGSFITDVYSFGNYLRLKKPMDKILSKEGSAMAVKRVLDGVTLGCFNRAKNSLAPALYEIISQLKSAKVGAETVKSAAENTDGILSAKLKDVAAVYAAYENFLTENGFLDQSSALGFLPDVIKNSDEIRSADVYVLGFTGFTAEALDVVDALITRAKNFTAILPEGENKFAFVNETAAAVRKLCAARGLGYSELKSESGYSAEGAVLRDGLFNPLYKREKRKTANVCAYAAKNPAAEAETVAATIKRLVMDGKCRYRDVTVVMPDPAIRRVLKNAFGALEVPFFLDERKTSPVNPLVSLAESYINVFKYGLTRKTFAPFFKNPLVCGDRFFTDAFENYLLKINADRAALTKPLFDDGDEKYSEYENFRKYAVGLLDGFDVKRLFARLGVKEKAENASLILGGYGEKESAAVNAQIYDAVTGILDEMRVVLGDARVSYAEYGRIFASGVAALELSVIPQYNDAVFVGGFREAALCRAKYLFVTGLTSAVPGAKDDTALLTDDDLDRLAELKVLIEPKIKAVNHREREYVALGTSAFGEKLFASYPVSDFAGGRNVKSEIYVFLENNFTLSPFPETDGYLTEKQGLKNFSSACGRFIEGYLNDFTEGASFYRAAGGTQAKEILDNGGKEVKVRLNDNARALLKDVTSPTAIEDFYKCPYRSFVIHGLNVRKREDGRPDAPKSGNFAHDVFKRFTENADGVIDERTFEKIFSEAVSGALNDKAYSGFFSDDESQAALSSLIAECKKYCKRLYEWLRASAFRTDGKKTEVRFGDGGEYPAISLLGGRIKLSGKIDRVDTYKDYCRIIDYKTGKADDSEKGLFTGTKLQLYLYAAAVKDKKLAGAYYIPVDDSYKKPDGKNAPLAVGKTLADDECIAAQDGNFSERGESDFIPVKTDKGKLKNAYGEKTMRALVEYALKISENAAREMDGGVVAPSPYDNTCDYCEFRSLCGVQNPIIRKVGNVNGEVIEKSAECEPENALKSNRGRAAAPNGEDGGTDNGNLKGDRVCPN